jgi:predicted nucleic acid-binding protein
MIVIDSDIIIWILRGDRDTAEKFRQVVIKSSGNVFVTPVQIAEIYKGMLPKEKEIVEHFFESLQVLTFNEKTGKLAGEFMNKYGRSHNVTLADALIASATRLGRFMLWTINKKHYPMLRREEFYQ